MIQPFPGPSRGGGLGAARSWIIVDLNGPEPTIEAHRRSDSGRRIYVFQEPDRLIVASHVRLLKACGVEIQFDDEVQAETLLYRFCMAPRTLFRGIRQLSSGQKARFESTASGQPSSGWKETTLERFAPWSDQQNEPTDKALAEQFAEAMEAAHEDPGYDPATFTTFLSGGLDSSILAKIGERRFGLQRTFSCAYPFADPRQDVEFQYASTAAASMGMRHTIHVPTTAEYLHAVLDSVIACEQSTLHLQTALLRSVIQRDLVPGGFRVATCGEGADGLFGQKIQRVMLALGEKPIARMLLGSRFSRPLLSTISSLTNRFGMLADLAGRDLGPGSSIDDPFHVLWSCGIFGDRDMIVDQLRCDTRAFSVARSEALAPYADRPLLDQFFLLNQLGEVSETQAVWSDVAEDLGVWLTYPFSHTKVVRTVCAASWSKKLAGSKKAAKDAARRLGIDDFIVDRPKASFGTSPAHYGPRNSLIEPLVMLAAPGFGEARLRAMQSGNVMRAQMLFSAVNLGILRRNLIEGDSRADLHAELDECIRRLGLWDCYTAPAFKVPPGTPGVVRRAGTR